MKDRSALLLKALFNNCNVTYKTITTWNLPTTCIMLMNSNFSCFQFANNTIHFPANRIAGMKPVISYQHPQLYHFNKLICFSILIIILLLAQW